MSTQDWDATPANNTTVPDGGSGINIAEGCAAANVNNALRQIMATIKGDLSGSDANILTGTTGTDGYIPKWNADGDLVDGFAVSGSDTTIISGTPGTDGYAAVWNADGDLVDGKAFSGSDAAIITGTAAAAGNLAAWNADGDLVDGGAFAESLGASGYTTFPNGLIVQWGFASVPSAIAITFPLTFPTNVYSVVVTGNNVSVPVVPFVGNKSTTAFDCRVTDINGNFVTNGVFWMATGD